MNRLILVFKVLLATIPFALLGYFLHYSLRHVHPAVYYTGAALVLGGALYFVYNKRKVYADAGKEQDIPSYFANSTYLYLIIGAVLGTLVTGSAFRTTLYIDNGKATAVEVTIPNDGTHTIEAHKHLQTSVPTGDNEITIDGKVKKLSLPESGKWVYNIDSINVYLESTVDYSANDKLYKDGKADSTATETEAPDFKIVRGELFKADVDYLFDAPESISIKKRDADKAVTKTVLYRINDLDSLGND